MDLLRLGRGAPSTSTLPELGYWSPRITRSNVVLPAPFDPISPVNSPARTEKQTSCSTCRPANETLTPSTPSSSRIGVAAGGRGISTVQNVS